MSAIQIVMLIVAVVGLLSPFLILRQKWVDRRRGEPHWESGGTFGGRDGDGGCGGAGCGGGGCGGGGD